MCLENLKKLCSVFVSIVLVVAVALPVVTAPRAYADDLTEAQETLNAASAQLDQLSKEYAALQEEAAAIEKEIADITQKTKEAQTAMIKGQEVLGESIEASYRNSDTLSIVNVFLASEDLDMFLKNVDYLTAIQREQAELVAAQKKRRDDFANALDELDKKRDEQQAKLDEAAKKKEEAQQVVAAASAKVSSIESERARLAELQAQAEAMEAQKRAEQEISSNWNTGNRPDGGSGTATPMPDQSGAGTSTSGWSSGVASAYGGASDRGTPNPGRTATGAICDDNSWGVAVPMAWPNYRSLLGRSVEIRYGGKTVIATVNDCGYMGGGSRSLDLQPGVFKAFGFSTCQAWGLRTVQYRFL